MDGCLSKIITDTRYLFIYLFVRGTEETSLFTECFIHFPQQQQ